MKWPTIPISELTESSQYGTSAKAEAHGRYPILRMGNITYDGHIDISKLKYIDLKDRELDRYTVRQGDILFNRTNSPDLVGKTAVFREKEPYAFAGYLVRLRTNSLADPGYLSAYLNSVQGKATLRSMAKSIVGMANINARELGTICVPVPPLNEQRRIASILDQADALRRKRREAMAKLEELKWSTLVQQLGDPGPNPREWPKTSLGRVILSVANGMTRRRADAEIGKDTVLRLRDIRAGWIDFSNVNKITLSDREKVRFLIHSGDLLFIRVNGNPEYVGRCAVFDNHIEDIYFNDHIMRVSLDRRLIDPLFVQAILNSDFGRSQIASHMKTSAGQHTINQDGLSKIEIPLPPLNLQEKFSAAWLAVATTSRTFENSSVYLDSLLASLQHRAFAGEL